MNFLWIILIIFALIVITSIRVIYEYERGVKFTLGKYTGLANPGLTIVFPIIQSINKIDVRVKTVDVPKQECITKDNVSVGVDAVVYYYVTDSKKSILNVEDFYYAIHQLSQTTMRDIVGEVTLDELLSNRDSISEKIRKVIDKESDPWGIKVNNMVLKDIRLPEDLKRVMAREAEAEREKRGIIIKSEGEVTSAKKFNEAAKILAKSDGAMELRNLQTINDIAPSPSVKYLFFPMDIAKSLNKKNK